MLSAIVRWLLACWLAELRVVEDQSSNENDRFDWATTPVTDVSDHKTPLGWAVQADSSCPRTINTATDQPEEKMDATSPSLITVWKELIGRCRVVDNDYA